MQRNRAKRRLRALFITYASALQEGTYIFVAKQAINETTHEKLISDFEKVLNRLQTFKKSSDG